MMSEKGLICRLCLERDKACINVFSNEGKAKELQNILQTIFKQEIKFSDNHTENADICTFCCTTVSNFYEFYKTVIQNQSYFEDNENIILIDVVGNYLNLENDGKIHYAIKIEGIENETSGTTAVAAKRPLSVVKNDDEEKTATSLNVRTSSRRKTLIRAMSQPIKDSSTGPIDSEMPVRLKIGSLKAQTDAQIREFVNLVCDLCKFRVDTFKELQKHFTEEHQTKGYVICCERKFYRKDRIINHITNHVNPDAFKCSLCGQNSKSKPLLRIHMKQHCPIEERKFHCEKCPQRFVLKSQLTNHEASHLTDDQKRFVCDECGKAFALKFVMIKHKLTHSKKKDFVCDICAKSFSTNTNLLSHRAQHTSEPTPRVQCNLCNLWYKNIETLRSHLRRHRDKRKHICSNCDKECTTRSSLAAHIRYVHLKVTDHECSICAKRFRRKLELKEHMARHTGEVLYRCPNCPKTFASSSNYFSHRKNRHPENVLDGKSELFGEK